MSYPITGKWKDPNTRAEFVVAEATDGVPVHGALYISEAGRPHDMALLAYHGAGANFYSGPGAFLAPGVAAKGYVGLTMNLRDHGRQAYRATFEPCALDIAAAVALLRERGISRIVLWGHSLSVTQIIYYLAQQPDPAVCGAILSGGHWDLGGEKWRAWTKLIPDNPRCGYDELVARCEEMIANGHGDELMIIPWWQPDPNNFKAEHYRPISPKTFLSYYGPDTKCRACLWIDKVRVPLLIVTHDIVDTVASPEMADQLRDGAVNAPFVDYLNVGNYGHFYIGCEQLLIDSVAAWMDKLRTGAPAAAAR